MTGITDDEYGRIAEFRYQLRRFLHFSEEAAKAAGLTPRQHQALLAIRGFPDGRDPTIGELAERLQIRHHSAVELVNRMVSAGLVDRKESDIDRRQVLVGLTAAGRSRLEKLTLTHRDELARMREYLFQLI